MNDAIEPASRAHNQKRGILRFVFLGFIVAVVGLVTVAWYVGGKLSAPANRPVGTPPASLAAASVTFSSSSGSLIHGWMSQASPGQGAILLLHGVRGNREDMIGRAEFLRKIGYSVLLIDLQAHGQSSGQYITLGYLESQDVIAAREFLQRNMPNERIGAIGVSLGAAAIVLADGHAAFDAVVLESMYPTIDEAIADRLRLHLGTLGIAVSPLLSIQLRPRLGIGTDQLRPIDRIATLAAPLLLVHGALDRHTPVDEARAIFAAAAAPKQLWIIPDAAHVTRTPIDWPFALHEIHGSPTAGTSQSARRAADPVNRDICT
jgi:uncharacterized protein